MDNNSYLKAQELLSTEDLSAVLDVVRNTDDNALMYFLINDYVWDNGFDIPRAVLNNPNVQPAILLLLFYRADGIRVLLNPDALNVSLLKDWPSFVREVMAKLDSIDKTQNTYAYIPEMSKVEMFKAKKASPNLPEFYFDGFSGEHLPRK